MDLAHAPASESSHGSSLATRVALGWVAVVLAVGVVFMALTPPGIFSDSVSGFMVTRSMERGAPIGHVFTVDPDNIAVDRAEFSAWWTPGQYAVPMLLAWTGLDLGQRLSVTIGLLWLIGGLGYWRLFRRLGFGSDVAAISLAVVVSQTYVLWFGRFYHGGSQLEWSYLPWFVLLCLRGRGFAWAWVPAIVAGFALGIFFKSSFAILGASVIAAVAGLEARSSGGLLRPAAVALGLRAALAAAIALALFAAYVSLGSTPAGETAWTASGIAVREWLFAAAGPLNSLFDLGALYVPVTESTDWLAGEITAPLLGVVALTALLGLGIWRMFEPGAEYPLLVAGVFGAVVVSYGLAWSLDLLISFNVRHFQTLGALFVPGIVALVWRAPHRVARGLGLAVLAGLCLAMVVRYATPKTPGPLTRPVGAAGFSHIYSSQAAVDAVSEVDAALEAGNNLIGVPWAQLGLEVRESRVLDMRTGLEGGSEYARKVLFGRVHNLVVVLPMAVHERGGTEAVLSAFREHDDWRRIRTDVEDYVFMHSGSDRTIR